jgi:gentisate 1,2-dioxygenase
MLHYYQAGFANPFHDRQQAVTKPTGWSQKTYNVLRPQSAPAPISKNYRPPYRYAWKDTEKAFESVAESPGDPTTESRCTIQIRSAAAPPCRR